MEECSRPKNVELTELASFVTTSAVTKISMMGEQYLGNFDVGCDNQLIDK
jgi:hypothetical protein